VQFLNSLIFCFRLSLKNCWGNGITYDEEKTAHLVNGENQLWYSFKTSLLEHLACNPKRSGGDFHFKAKQFEAAQQRKTKSNIQANTNVVTAGIEVCKMKSAACSFESMLGFMSFCRVDVGNIGHGR